MDINVCKHHHHHNIHNIQEYQHSCVMEGSNSHLGVCVNNSNCVMSRLSPCDDEHRAVPLPRDVCAPFSVLETPTVYNHDSNMSIGLDPSSCLLKSYSRVIHSPCLQLDGLRYESTKSRLDPHSPLCMVPLPENIGEPNFIRRRNERERERVRCVNDGYDRLKEHLPLADKDRRLSKVDTLRGAIKYIRQLKRLLEESDDDHDDKDIMCRQSGAIRNKRFLSSSRIYRSSSLSSSDQDSSLSDS